MAMILNQFTGEMEEMENTPAPKDGKIEIKPVNQNSLKGVVTPLDQQLLRNHGSMNIATIIDNPQLLGKFAQYELPSFMKTGSGIFFEPIGKVVSNANVYFVKWFCLRNDFSVSADHSFEFARLFPDGYLMKVMIPRTHDEINDFSVLYVTPVDRLDTYTISGKIYTNPRELDDEPEVGQEQLYKINDFDPEVYPIVTSMITKRESFIKKYLSDVLEVD